MIGKPHWFNRRKYSGWGLMPKTWEGWAYIGVGAGMVALIQTLPIDPQLKFYSYLGIGALFLFDILHIMAGIKMDEREAKIEAMAERNASWTMVATVALTIVYVAQVDVDISNQELLPILIIPLLVGVVAKSLSNLYLQNKDL